MFFGWIPMHGCMAVIDGISFGIPNSCQLIYRSYLLHGAIFVCAALIA
jgi:hypothetical protein